MNLKDKVCLITGAASGIGLSAANSIWQVRSASVTVSRNASSRTAQGS